MKLKLGQLRRLKADMGYLTQIEVGRLLGISKQRVGQIEARALRKLREHPVIRELAEEAGIEMEETSC